MLLTLVDDLEWNHYYIPTSELEEHLAKRNVVHGSDDMHAMNSVLLY